MTLAGTTLALLLLALAALARGEGGERARLFPPGRVRLLEGPFRSARDLNLQTLYRYDHRRLLAPYMIDAGLEPEAPRYPNWESMGLDGHTAGHYMSALAHAAAEGEAEARKRLEEMAAALARCQQAHGDDYVGGIPGGHEMWSSVAAGRIESTGFSLNGRWVPLYNLHKTLAGLRDAWQIAGVEAARPVFLALADWCRRLIAGLTDDQVQDILRTEHGGMNEVLADAAEASGDPRLIEAAQRFSHRAILDPLAAGEDRLSGLHANTQVPKVIGFQRIADLTGDERMARASLHFWERVVNSRTLAFGGNSVSEHFPGPEQAIQFVEHREGPETCNTYNMLRLTEMLFAGRPEERFAAFAERALLNHILSTQHPEHGGYVYFTSARPCHYRVYSQPEKAFWCCVGTGMENHGRYARFLYARSEDRLWVNLFAASELDWQEKGLKLRQETRFPDESVSRLRFEAEEPVDIGVQIRWPEWSRSLRLKVNGEDWPASGDPGSYVEVRRTWRTGDSVEIGLDMALRFEAVPGLDEFGAILYGPVLLAAPAGAEGLDGLLAEDGRMDHIAQGPLLPMTEAPVLVGGLAHALASMTPVPGRPLAFTAPDSVRPQAFRSMELIPFFRLHDQRYVMTWRRLDEAGYERMKQAAAEEEKARLALDAATLDQVAPGRQQPEAEHGYQGEKAESGLWQGRHWRHSPAWFSYDLDPKGRKELDLMIVCSGSDERSFQILINGEAFQEVRLSRALPNGFVELRWPIPDRLLGSGRITVRFQANAGSLAGGIFDIRLLKR